VKKLWTPVKTFVNEARRGPGSNRILVGDERLGYFGKLTVDEFLDVSKVLALPGNVAAACRNLIWHKFIRKGKIIFVSDRPLMTEGLADRVWTQQVRRNLGFVSGMTWNFDTTAWAETKKTAIAEKNGDRFHFRALRGLPDDWNGSAPTAAMIENPETEFHELLQPLMSGEAYFPNKIGCLRTGAHSKTYLPPVECAERIGTGHLVRLMQPTSLPNPNWVASLNTYNRTKESFCAFITRAESLSEPSYECRTWDVTWPAFELID
jgi:hypothetical protein